MIEAGVFGSWIGWHLRRFEAAESVSGVEYYLIEQEGSRFPAIETAEQCLASYKAMQG